ncbi:hypothetical protein MAR_026790 [Mya arenaria]|uniref:Uncharacterized protein n=1 Tax=Mya arenaria TaxID=6604 RepID=A0ABY7ETJ0_MYAAR|nr:hypothetical protein MAR_026790 [Mya arenaria]
MASKQQQSEADAPRVYYYQCDEINKRSIGKVQLKYCGNEGTIDNTNKATLRRTLQAVISHIPNEGQSVWRNAEVKMFDDNFDKYIIRSGDGRYRFEAMDNGMDDFRIVKLRSESCCTIF